MVWKGWQEEGRDSKSGELLLKTVENNLHRMISSSRILLSLSLPLPTPALHLSLTSLTFDRRLK